MARNRVQVDIDGKDNLSSTVDGLVGKIRDGVFQAGLMERAMDAAFSAIGRVASSAFNAFQDASQAQLDTIKSAAGLQNVFEMSFNEAESLNLEITQMLAKLAAPLPGTTDDYLRLFRQISDDVAIANKEINGGTVDLESYKEQIGEITSKWTILGQGLTVGQRNNALRGLLSGDSLRTLRKLEFFEANPQVMKALEDAQELAGIKLQDMTRGQRLEVLLNALDVSMTDETLQRMTGSLDAQVQSFMSTLFDPTVGIFGFQRDLNESQQGVQSAFTAIAEGLAALIGSDGLFLTIGDVLTTLGFEFQDPMVTLQQAGFFFAAKIRFVTTVLKRFGAIFEASPDAAVTFLGNQINYFIKSFNLKNLGEWLSETINSIFQNAAGFDYGTVFAAIGKFLADVVNEASDFLEGLDYGAIAKTAINLIGAFLQGFGAFLLSLDFSSYISIAAIVGGVGIAALIGTAITTAAGLVTAAVSFAASVLAPGVVAAAAGLPIILVAGAALAIAALAKAIIDNWDALWGGIKATLDWIGNVIMGSFKMLAGIFTLNMDLAKDGMSQWLTGMTGLFDWLNARIDDVKAQFGMQTSGQARAEQVAMEAERRFQAANAADTRVITPVPSRSEGYIPNAANGLNVGGILQAAIREGQRMPSGAGLAIANTSEAILNQAQQRALANRLSASSGGGGMTINSLVVQSAATDAQGIAQDIMRAIADEYRAYQQSKLTAIAT